MTLTKIAIIGAGGYEFPLQLDERLPVVREHPRRALVLMDIDPVSARAHRAPPARASSTRTACRPHHRHHRPPRRAGGRRLRRRLLPGRRRRRLRARHRDPAAYGIDQTVGDTLGPGGVFRGLRSMHALRGDHAGHARAVPGRAAAAVREPDVDQLLVHVGRGHAHGRPVPLRAAHRGLPGERHAARRPATWSFRAAGINHQAWMLEYRHHGRDVTGRAAHRGARVPRGERDAHRGRWTSGTAAAASRCARRSWTSPATSRPSRATTTPSTSRTSAARRPRRCRTSPSRWDYLEHRARQRRGASCSSWPTEFAAGTLAVSEEYAAQHRRLDAHRHPPGRSTATCPTPA